MSLYAIVFTDGSELQEFGSSERDVRDFLARSYGHMTVKTIALA